MSEFTSFMICIHGHVTPKMAIQWLSGYLMAIFYGHKKAISWLFFAEMTATICWGSETRNCEAHTSKGGRIPLENKVPGHSCPSSVPPFNVVVICFVYCGKGMLLMLSLNHTLSTSYFSTLKKTKWHLHLYLDGLCPMEGRSQKKNDARNASAKVFTMTS